MVLQTCHCLHSVQLALEAIASLLFCKSTFMVTCPFSNHRSLQLCGSRGNGSGKALCSHYLICGCSLPISIQQASNKSFQSTGFMACFDISWEKLTWSWNRNWNCASSMCLASVFLRYTSCLCCYKSGTRHTMSWDTKCFKSIICFVMRPAQHIHKHLYSKNGTC